MDLQYLFDQVPIRASLLRNLYSADIFVLQYVVRGIGRVGAAHSPLVGFALLGDVHMVEWEHGEWTKFRKLIDDDPRKNDIHKHRAKDVKAARFYAAKYNHLELTRWFMRLYRTFDHLFAQAAANNGAHDVIEYLISDLAHEGAPSTKRLLRSDEFKRHTAHNMWLVKSAARAGNIAILNWMFEKCAHKWTNIESHKWINTVSKIAAECGHEHILQWMVNSGIRIGWTAHITAAERGNFEVLHFIHKHEKISVVAFVGAASFGRVDVMKWLREHGYEPESSAMRAAARCGRKEVMEWLRSIGMPWDKGVCVAAASRRNIETLVWVLANGAQWDPAACEKAPDENKASVIAFALENGLPTQ
jgi:hypothetical protein